MSYRAIKRIPIPKVKIKPFENIVWPAESNEPAIFEDFYWYEAGIETKLEMLRDYLLSHNHDHTK